jgi:putative FmdB family regulatory protein
VPEYDYRCTQCGHDFGVRKRIAEVAREERCPTCGSTTKRVWTVPAIAGPTCGSDGFSGGG